MISVSAIIEVKSVYKKYKKYQNSKERILDVILPGKYSEEFYALYDVDFRANEGEVVGFIGINGSGKSTLSNIIAGIVPETSGSVKVNGEVAIIAVSAGLKNDLTGRDNIELKLLMLGFTKSEIKELEFEIIEFAELEDFIDQPVKSYSSGMKSRLGFAISVTVNPDVLIIDEALSVGDRAFAEKSLAKMREFKNDGKTMIFVSHSLGQMRRFCDKILWLEYGRVKEYGDVDKVLANYEQFLDQWKQMTKEERINYRRNVITNEEEKNINYLKNVKDSSENYMKEKSITRMAKVKMNPHILIYNIPSDEKGRKMSEDERKYSFYVKKQITYQKERYFLISNLPSGTQGVIGWVKSSNLQTLPHVLNDEDEKTFEVIGDFNAYNKPWGSEGDIVINNLNEYEGMIFDVNRSERIGKHMWYYGKLKDKNVWIRWNQLRRID